MKKIIFLLLLFVLIPVSVLAWNDCPYGEINSSYPGDCGRYVDTDNDGICDHSQPAPEDRNNSTVNTQITENDNQRETVYPILLIAWVLTILYILSRFLSMEKIISVADHRKIWNILLIITFLISGLLGILLIIKINFGIEIPLPFNSLFWHVEAGIAMFVISIFHISWHLAYFKNMFKIKMFIGHLAYFKNMFKIKRGQITKKSLNQMK